MPAIPPLICRMVLHGRRETPLLEAPDVALGRPQPQTAAAVHPAALDVGPRIGLGKLELLDPPLPTVVTEHRTEIDEPDLVAMNLRVVKGELLLAAFAPPG